MIAIKVNTYPFDPKQRISYVLAEALREMKASGKLSCTLEITYPDVSEPLRFRLKFLGASRRDRRPVMTRTRKEK